MGGGYCVSVVGGKKVSLGARGRLRHDVCL